MENAAARIEESTEQELSYGPPKPVLVDATEFSIDSNEDDKYEEARSKDLNEKPTDRDAVGDYLREIGKTPLLTAVEEVELSKAIEAGLLAQEIRDDITPNTVGATPEEIEELITNGEAAKRLMLESNLRLVVSIAKRYTNRGMLFLDLIQEGNIGLVRAVEKFDFEKGYKFSTYATWWIKQALQRALADQSRTIRIPVHAHEKINKIDNTIRKMSVELGREPQVDEVAKELGWEEDFVAKLLEYKRQTPVSLNAPIGSDPDSDTLESRIASTSNPAEMTVEDEAVSREFASSIMDLLDCLEEREAKVIIERFGLPGSSGLGGPKTLDDVGKIIHRTRERVRQIERNALGKLRKAAEEKDLKNFRQ